MVYGMLFVNHTLYSSAIQRAGIASFCKKNGLTPDGFLSYRDMPDVGEIKPGDSVVFYAWSCVGKTRSQLKKVIGYLLQNKINFYSATGKYNAATGADFNHLSHAFGLYEDIRFNFLSHKNIAATRRRIARGGSVGRHLGTKNKTHVWDKYAPRIVSMHRAGLSMYRIAHDLNLTAPAVKRCLTANNVI